MNRRIQSQFLGLLVLGVVGGFVTTPPAMASSAGPQGAERSGPAAELPFPLLLGVDVMSSTDAWAVGVCKKSHGLVQHWDGTAWKVVDSPHPGNHSYLTGVSAVSAGDVWAVGYHYVDGAGHRVFIEHWDGSAWKVVSSALPDQVGELNGVTAVSSNNVWAAGTSYADGTSRTFIEHWDGASWAKVESPSPGSSRPGGFSRLQAINADGASDIWAVGDYSDGQHSYTLTEHWNGAKWLVADSFSPAGRSNHLNAVSTLSGNDAWAVGSFQSAKTLTEHWDGSTWSRVASPSPGQDVELFGVSGDTANDVWAVGAADLQPLILHWNGTRWSSTGGAKSGQDETILRAVSTHDTDLAVAVGYTEDDASATLPWREEWNGTSWGAS